MGRIHSNRGFLFCVTDQIVILNFDDSFVPVINPHPRPLIRIFTIPMGEWSHIIFEVIRTDPELDSGLIRFYFRPLCVLCVVCRLPLSLFSFSLSVSLFVVMIMTVRVLRPRPTYIPVVLSFVT